MRRRGATAVLALALLTTPAPGEACGLQLDPAQPPVPIGALPAGTVTGRAICQGVERQLSVWTLVVDPDAPDLGIRDRPLFRQRAANPLVPLASVGVGPGGRLTLFRRHTEPERPADEPPGARDLRAPYRLFGTYCDAGAGDPLDCAAGRARVKMRADVVDHDGDGALDRVRHSVSIWDGGDRLRVLMFETRHTGRPLGNAAAWVEALALAGLL